LTPADLAKLLNAPSAKAKIFAQVPLPMLSKTVNVFVSLTLFIQGIAIFFSFGLTGKLFVVIISPNRGAEPLTRFLNESSQFVNAQALNYFHDFQLLFCDLI
jgi:hypothetical protein